jgi:hypothetical protein
MAPKGAHTMSELYKYLLNMGWYGGKSLVTIIIESCFEGWSSRATEAWETRVIVDTKEVKNSDGKILVPNMRVVGTERQSLDEICAIVMSKIQGAKT